jgi:hypothetical protein
MLGGRPLRQQRAKELNRYLAWQVLHEYFVSKTSSHDQLKQHYRFLTCELWKISEPEFQAGRSFKAYTEQFAGTSEVVAKSHGTTARDSLYNPLCDEVEAAFYVMTLHRLMNVWTVARWTLELMKFDSVELLTEFGINLRESMALLSERPRLLFTFCPFLQTFLFVWGGFLMDANRDWEIQKLANECSTTTEAVELYIRVFNTIYTGSMIAASHGRSYVKWVPAAFRALGIRHRRALDPTTYGPTSFFGDSDPLYDVALNRALSAIGGVTGLRY